MRLLTRLSNMVTDSVSEDGICTLAFMDHVKYTDLEMFMYDEGYDTVDEAVEDLKTDAVMEYVELRYGDQMAPNLLTFITEEY